MLLRMKQKSCCDEDTVTFATGSKGASEQPVKQSLKPKTPDRDGSSRQGMYSMRRLESASGGYCCKTLFGASNKNS